MKRNLASRCLALLVCLGCAVPASAHEFVLKPAKTSAAPGEIVPFQVVSTHVFMASEEMESPKVVEAALVQNGQKTPLALTPNEAGKTLDGVFKAKAGPAILTGERKGVIWSETTQGAKEGSRKDLAGQTVLKSSLYEKHAKTILNAAPGESGFGAVVGQPLEIVPLTNPAEAKVGEDMLFKVLYKGQPISTNVYATYDGFTSVPNSYAYFTEGAEDGVTRVRITKPGLWMVRTQREDAEKTPEYDVRVLRATLVFEVR